MPDEQILRKRFVPFVPIVALTVSLAIPGGGQV